MPPGRIDGAPPLTDSYRLPMPRAGTLRNLFCRHNSAGGGGAGTITYVVYKNGVATAMTVALTATVVGTGSDLVNAVAVVQGDLVSLAESNSGGAVSLDAQVTLELA
jgi:hypothetical protein